MRSREDIIPHCNSGDQRLDDLMRKKLDNSIRVSQFRSDPQGRKNFCEPCEREYVRHSVAPAGSDVLVPARCSAMTNSASRRERLSLLH